MEKNVLLGSHISYSRESQLLGVVSDMLEENANVFMFYTGSPQSIQRFDIDDNLVISAKNKMNENGIDITKCVVHAPYIINLSNVSDESKYAFYISFFRQEIDRCNKLGISNLVFHPGNAVNCSREEAIINTANGVSNILKGKNINLLVEFMAGKGSEIGSSIDEIKSIIDAVDEIERHKVYVCLDTCHMNDAGIDISHFDDFLEEFDREIGIDRIKCVHLNDSQNSIGAHKDRHANIGYGTIGFDNLVNVLFNDKLKDVPKILETPYINGNPPYKKEIEMLISKKIMPLD